MIVVFDIETIPDIAGGQKMYDLQGISLEETAKAMLATRRIKVEDTNFLPLHQHQVIAISVVVRWDQNNFLIKSLGNLDSSESELIHAFFRAIEKIPVLVSWNGSGFDLPVLQYRALIHGIVSATYWDTGDFDRDFKWNNYQSRFHKRHVDVMEVLSRFQPRASAALDEIAKLIGLPGKIGVGGANIFSAYCEGKLQEIRDYCEIDALNTYLIYLRFEYIRGNYSIKQYEEERLRTRNWLAESDKPHFQEYKHEWQKNLDLP